MTLDGFLYAVQVGLLMLLYPTGFILTRAALRKPYELALVLMALVVDAIALGMTTLVWAAANAAAGYPVPADVVRAVVRGAFIPLELFGLLFLVAYQRRWFTRDDTPDGTAGSGT